jgi:hypothetical protein
MRPHSLDKKLSMLVKGKRGAGGRRDEGRFFEPMGDGALQRRDIIKNYNI